MKSKAVKTAKAMSVVILIVMGMFIAIMALLPFLSGSLLRLFVQYFIHYVPTVIFIYVGGTLALVFLWWLRRLVVSVGRGNPFVKKNVVILKRISYVLLFLVFDFIYLFLCVPSISTLLCIGVLLLAVFSARVLAYLIARATEYREEIDFTV